MDILLFEPPYKCQDKLRDVKPAWRVQIDSNGSVVSEPIESCLPGTYLPPMTHWCCSRAPCFLKGMCVPTDSLPSHKSASDSLGWGGRGGIITSLAFPHDLDATLYDLHWHFHMILMLRSMIFIGISTWTWCYALGSSIAIPHDLDATLYDLQLQFHMILMLRSMIFNWHFHMILMLRSMIFIGISTWSWCYALWSSLAFPHEPDATLYDLQLQFHMNLMPRSMIFIGISTWSWCYADDLHWHFHMNLMLRSMIFNVRKSCGCPFWGWSVGRVVITKVDGPFFR